MDRYEINTEICKLITNSIEPLEDLKSIMKTCSVLWDQHIILEDNKIKMTILRVKTEYEIIKKLEAENHG